jgi:hypothetical protein
MLNLIRFARPFRGALSWWALSLLLAASAQAQNAGPRHAILIDGSGSMTGFFDAEEKKVQELHRVLRAICGDSSASHYFVNRELVMANDDSPTGYGDETFLDDALRNALAQRPAPGILWLITDNQPSAGGQTRSDADIQAFYEQLRGDTIKRLYLFPLRLPFKGTLYKEDGHSKLTDNYAGKRGLLVYALLIDDRALAEFERVTQELQNRFGHSQAGGVPRLLIKPFQEDTITAELVPGDQPDDKFRVLHGTQLVAGDFETGAPIKGKFKILLRSKLRQMTINYADIDVHVIDKFQTGDFAESVIVPKFDPRMIKDFEPRTEQPISVTIDAPPVQIRNNPLSWWNCILKNRGDINGRIQILIKVPGQKIGVVSSVADEFSTSSDIYNVADEPTQARIYKLNDLVKQMMPSQGAVDIRPRIGDSTDGVIPVRLTVLYPKWPGWLLVGIIILLVLLALIAWRFFGRRQFYRLTWDNGNYRACPDFRLWPFVGQRVELDNHTAATIGQGLSGIRVRAASGYTVDDTKARPVNPSGSDFNLSQSADGTGVTFYFSSTTAAFSGGLTAVNHDDDILGGVSYGESGDAGGGSVMASTPPIRKPTSGRTKVTQPTDTHSTGDEDNINLDDLFP